MGAEALALMAEEAWRQEQDKKKASSAAPASAAIAPVQPSSAAPSDSGAALLPGLSKAQQARRTEARMGTPASAALSSAELIQPSAAPAQVLTRDNAVSGAKNTLESMVSTIAARIGTLASPAPVPSSPAPLQPSSPAPVPSSEVRQPFRSPPAPSPSSPPLFRPIIPSSVRTFEESPSMMDRASRSGVDYTPFEPTRQALFSSPPPSSADQSVLNRISSLEKELEDCYKKVELRQNLLKSRVDKNVAQQEQIRVLEQQLQQARQAQREQIRVLEQQLQQARQAQQVLDDDATSSNASSASSSSASFKSATSHPYDDEGADEGGKRKTKFKKNKKMYNKTSKMYNKTSKMYNKTSKKYKNKKARY
jgi:hypothetical protein